MRIGIMQPYFFPYLGYWQLMNSVDRYVIYDDVNFIKRGHINRNTILVNGKEQKINLILFGASRNKHINEVHVNTDPLIQNKLLRTIEMSYKKAPHFSQVFPLIKQVVVQQETDVAKYLKKSFEIIGDYLGITTELLLSSELEKDCSLKAHNKIIAICKLLDGNEYYNSIGGIQLYEPYREEFEREGIQLRFSKMRDVVYPQFKNEFVPNLSIIDVMMFNSREECQRLLAEFDLV